MNGGEGWGPVTWAGTIWERTSARANVMVFDLERNGAVRLAGDAASPTAPADIEILVDGRRPQSVYFDTNGYARLRDASLRLDAGRHRLVINARPVGSAAAAAA